LTYALLQRTGEAKGIKSVKNQSSSYTIALTPPYIDRIFLHHPGTNDLFSADDLDPLLLTLCRHFHFGYPPLMKNMFRNQGKELRRVFRMAMKAGTITSCDMSLPDPASESGKAPWRTILENFLPFVHIFLPSAEEACFMLEPEQYSKLKEKEEDMSFIDYLSTGDIQRLAMHLLELGTGMVVLKCGSRGLYLKSAPLLRLAKIGMLSEQAAEDWADRELWCPAFKIDRIASATGSGDAAIAGFLSAFMRNSPPEECLKNACILGWENLHRLDAVSGIKSCEETAGLLRKPPPLNFFEMNDAGWSWVAEKQLWAAIKDPLNKQK
jgi:sugar/nucleoside kinase (ribokinase family)